MNRVELESFIKSFILFFISLNLLIGIILFLQYKQDIRNINHDIFNQMKVCSFNLKCKNIHIAFIAKNKHLLYLLKKKNDTLSSYFNISNSNKYMMKLTFKKNIYKLKIKNLQNKFFIQYLFIFIAILILSSLFSLYALNPLRQALLLTEEFIKDILHDFNTPLSVLRLNSDMLIKEIGSNIKVTRIQQGVQSILALQANLKAYLQYQSNQVEQFSLNSLITKKISLIQKIYPNIHFIQDVSNVQLFLNKDAFSRIIENLLTNAAKYNKKNGFVKITFSNNTLIIQDSGIGIKYPDKIFNRFYKENSRGIGIGLHIVKKLCNELKIKISLKSKVNEGTIFKLTLR